MTGRHTTHHATHADTPDLSPRPARRGFTLVELLVVVAIIAILAGIVLVAAGGISGKRKIALTQDILNTLDRAMDEYHVTVGSYPSPDAEDWDGVPGASNGTVGYPTATDQHAPYPDAAVFISKARGVGGVDAILAGIPDRFLVTTIERGAGDETLEDPTPSVLDAWGVDPWPRNEDGEAYDITRDRGESEAFWQQVIFYVHPGNDYAEDLYGLTRNGRPYFMSAGPDLRYGLINEIPIDFEGDPVEQALRYTEDNIYSYDVGPLKETMGADDRDVEL